MHVITRRAFVSRVNHFHFVTMHPYLRLVCCAAFLALTGCPDDARSGSNDRPPPVVNPDPRVARFTVVKSWPHDPAAFTQGLEFEKGRLYEGTGTEGKSTLREVALETGDVIRMATLPPEVFGEGITVLGNRIYQLTWKSKKGFVYDLASFKRISEFTYDGEGWGLANDGSSLIMSDGSAHLYFRDPATFAVTRTVEVRDRDTPVPKLNELEWVNGEIYANVWETDSIVRINPQSGAVIGWVNMRGLFSGSDRGRYLQPGQVTDVLNGIAWDDSTKRLVVTGKWWPRIYQITVDSTDG
jgi:glutaminyl-peptide cyclotransferase